MLHAEVTLSVLLRHGVLVHRHRTCEIQTGQGRTLRLLLRVEMRDPHRHIGAGAVAGDDEAS